jgi:hypothetical protein
LTASLRSDEIAFDVKQNAGTRQASGFFRLTDPGFGTMIDMKTVSLLQTAEKWASFTGRSPLRRGDIFLFGLAPRIFARIRPIRRSTPQQYIP